MQRITRRNQKKGILALFYLSLYQLQDFPQEFLANCSTRAGTKMKLFLADDTKLLTQ